MSNYIHFTDAQKEQAASVDLEVFLRSHGEKLLTSGREKRLVSNHSITIRGNEWYDHATEQGGNAISFVKKHYGLSYPEAVTMLLGETTGTVYPSAKERVEEPPKPFALPPAHDDMCRVYAYLVKHRKIDRAVVSEFARHKLIYEDGKYHDVICGGFAPNSEAAETFSKALGNRTVLSGSVNRGKNDPSQSLQMMERPLMTADELKSVPKGSFIVQKTGCHPMRTRLRLFLELGITFEGEHLVEERSARSVCYADRDSLSVAIEQKYPSEKVAFYPERVAKSGGQMHNAPMQFSDNEAKPVRRAYNLPKRQEEST